MAVLKPAYSKSISQSLCAVVEEIGGQQIVVAEDDRQRRLRAPRARRQAPSQARQLGSHARAAAGLERAGIVADDMEDPEHEARARDVARHRSCGNRA